MKSPYGRRGSICSHFGWTWEYLHNGIAWCIVERMMIDAPHFDTNAKDDDSKVINLKEESADNIMNYVNNLI